MARFGMDLFEQYWPPEMGRDFRKGISPAWRGGVFCRESKPQEFTALFGNQVQCDQVCELLRGSGIEGRIDSPGIKWDLMCDGEDLGPTRVAWWRVFFEIPDEVLEEKKA